MDIVQDRGRGRLRDRRVWLGGSQGQRACLVSTERCFGCPTVANVAAVDEGEQPDDKQPGQQVRVELARDAALHGWLNVARLDIADLLKVVVEHAATGCFRVGKLTGILDVSRSPAICDGLALHLALLGHVACPLAR